MKKAIVLLLALVMCLSFVACGGNDTSKQETTELPVTIEAPTEPIMTKEEMLAVATELDGNELLNAVMDNKLRAQETYVGNTYLYTANVSSIEQDHAVIGYFNVYMPTEDLMKLNTLQQVTVVGQITALDTETEQGAFGVQTSVTGEMPTAYFVTDRYEIRCVIQTAGIKLVNAEGKQLDGIRKCQWAEGVDKSQYEWQEVTISAKIVYDSLTFQYEYYDVTIVN